MAEFNFGDGIKRFFLAGIGAVATTAEKSSEIIDSLVKKGELTVEQGKELNKEMQQNLKARMAERGVNIDEMSAKVTKMSADELAKLKEIIAGAEKSLSERLEKAEESAEEAIDEVVKVLDNADEAAEDAAVEAAEDAAQAVEEAGEAAGGAVEEAAAEAAEAVEEAAEKIEE